MTLPVASNLISLSDIQTEFGGVNPIDVAEYYAGGVYVHPVQVGYPLGVSTPIPISGLISFANFHGATKYIPIVIIPIVITRAIPNIIYTLNVNAGSLRPITATGGNGTLSYSISSSLPTGLNFDVNTGAITGTPTQLIGTTSFTVTVRDPLNQTASGSFNLSVIRGVPPALANILDLASFLGTSWSFSWSETSGSRCQITTNYSVGSQGYPLITGAYNSDDTAQLGGNRSGGVNIASASGRDYRGRASPTFTISNPQYMTAQFRIRANWWSHSHTRINWMVYESNGTLLSQTGYVDYNFNVTHRNPGGARTISDTVVNIAANSSRTFYVRADGFWNGDRDYAPRWWSVISSVDAYFIGYI
jgi:hypothetical protein